MSLLFRINAALCAVFLIAALLTGYVCWRMLEANAQREVLTEAGLMMDSAAGARTYTANEVLPLSAAAFLVVNILLYRLIVRPVRRIARIADQVSLGDNTAGEFPPGGAREIASMTRSFDRLRKSLEKALRMLGG